MKLAEGKPLQRRMMAAMAQQDCGQCGYTCQDYSSAVFLQKEERLNLCVPGGKETARTLKTLYLELEARCRFAPRGRDPAGGCRCFGCAGRLPGRSRDHPAEAIFRRARRLNKDGLGQGDLAYRARSHRHRDRIRRSAIPSVSFPPTIPRSPTRCSPRSARRRISRSAGATLRDVLIDGVSLGTAPDMLFQLLSYITGGERRQKAKALASGEDPDGDAAGLDVLAAIEKFRGVRPDPEAFIEALDPLQPRLYSISSSPKIDPNRVALCVDAVRYPIKGARALVSPPRSLPTASAPAQNSSVYVQKAQPLGCRPTRRSRSS